jgi:hypothetical protein
MNGPWGSAPLGQKPFGRDGNQSRPERRCWCFGRCRCAGGRGRASAGELASGVATAAFRTPGVDVINLSFFVTVAAWVNKLERLPPERFFRLVKYLQVMPVSIPLR